MKRNLFYILIVALLQSCLAEPEMTQGIVNPKNEPTVVSGENEITGEGSLRFKGTITAEGSEAVTQRGICWSFASHEPNLIDSVVYDNNDTDDFSIDINYAKPDTTYYWRSFAINRYGVSYGASQQIKTPSVWGEQDQFRSNLRLRFAYFRLNNKFYIVCGDNYNITFSDIWEYDVEQNKWWGSLPTFPDAARRYPVAFVIGNNAYIGTGQSSASVAYNDFYIFNGTTKTWDANPVESSFDIRYQASAFSHDNKGYVFGGQYLGQAKNDVWQYSEETGEWTRKNDFPVNFYGGICLYNKNRIFAGFGDNADSKSILWEYNPQTDTWNVFTQLPDEITSRIYSGVIINNPINGVEMIYIIDGQNIIWELNLSDKSWRKKRALPDIFKYEDGSGGNQILLTTENGNTIYTGLGFQPYFYEYHPFWDN
jgi:hypothetical protein